MIDAVAGCTYFCAATCTVQAKPMAIMPQYSRGRAPAAVMNGKKPQEVIDGLIGTAGEIVGKNGADKSPLQSGNDG